MKAKTAWLAVIFVVVVVVVVASEMFMTAMEQDRVSLRASLSRRVYLQGDPIPLTVEMHNRGGFTYTPRYVPWRDDGWYVFQVVVRYEDGTVCVDPTILENSWGRRVRNRPESLAPLSVWKTTMNLNDLALISEPGWYTVQVVFAEQEQESGEDIVRENSTMVRFRVEPRSDQDMNTYIQSLSTQLANTLQDSRDYEEIVRKLLYIRDIRILTPLLGLWRSDMRDWEKARENGGLHIDGPFVGIGSATSALMVYLPLDEQVSRAGIDMALEMQEPTILFRFGYTREDYRKWLRDRLSCGDLSWVDISRLAESSPDDMLTSEMARLALDANQPEFKRSACIRTFAYHRAEEALAALTTLLDDPNDNIRYKTADTIRYAFERMRQHEAGERKEPGDIEKSEELVRMAMDARAPGRLWAVYEICAQLGPADYEILLGVIEGDASSIARANEKELTQAVSSVLTDKHKDVRDLGITLVRISSFTHAGCPYRQEDFGPGFMGAMTELEKHEAADSQQTGDASEYYKSQEPFPLDDGTDIQEETHPSMMEDPNGV